MKKKVKFKLKKGPKLVILGILVLVVVGIVGSKIKEDIDYKKSNEYLLLQKGYSTDEVSTILGYEEDRINLFLNRDYNSTLYELFLEKYFIYDNLGKYLEYKEKNKDMDLSKVVAMVNVHRNEAFYDNSRNADTTLGELMLVNKYYKLDENYTDSDMVSVSGKYGFAGNEVYQNVLDAFVKMYNAALSEDIQLIMNGSYRSYKDQDNTWAGRKRIKGEAAADSYTARAGYSEHQSGYAMDIDQYNYSGDDFKESPANTWLLNNAYKYGFIQRYPEGLEDITGFNYEPWHYRYVGIDVASRIHSENITFDEYYAYYVENK